MRVFAQGAADDIIGRVTNPLPGAYQNLTGSAGQPGGLIFFLSNILRLVFVVAGIFAFFNFIIAGFQYMNAAGDSKALSAAWNRIWNSLLGLIVVIASFALAALAGQILFGDPTYILNPKIYGPGQ